jgi:hypothetical protein
MISTNDTPALGGIACGGDGTPEQRPREVRRDDVAPMREAGWAR